MVVNGKDVGFSYPDNDNNWRVFGDEALMFNKREVQVLKPTRSASCFVLPETTFSSPYPRICEKVTQEKKLRYGSSPIGRSIFRPNGEVDRCHGDYVVR